MTSWSRVPQAPTARSAETTLPPIGGVGQPPDIDTQKCLPDADCQLWCNTHGRSWGRCEKLSAAFMRATNLRCIASGLRDQGITAAAVEVESAAETILRMARASDSDLAHAIEQRKTITASAAREDALREEINSACRRMDEVLGETADCSLAESIDAVDALVWEQREAIHKLEQDLSTKRELLHREIIRSSRLTEERDDDLEKLLRESIVAVQNGASHCSVCRRFHGPEVRHACE